MSKPLCNFSDFSRETLVKLQVKINKIEEYFLFYEAYKSQFSDELNGGRISPRKIFNSMAHQVIYVLYRSLFKDIENIKIVPATINGYEEIESSHQAIMTIVDKDICHHDKNSETFKLLDVNNFLSGHGSLAIMQAYLGDNELERVMNFLVNKFLPKIQNAGIKR